MPPTKRRRRREKRARISYRTAYLELRKATAPFDLGAADWLLWGRKHPPSQAGSRENKGYMDGYNWAKKQWPALRAAGRIHEDARA